MSFACRYPTDHRVWRPSLRLPAVSAILVVLALGVPTAVRAQGIYLPAIGPINQGMGGAAVAAPLDSAGSLNWNPATISGLSRSEIGVALGVILPTMTLSSEAFGLAGTTRGQSGPMPVPTMSFVLKNPNSPWTWGVGVYGIGGFSANFPSSSLADPASANPILTPQPPNGVGVGRIYSHADIYQVAPTVSYALTDKLSAGFAPTIDLADVQVDPLTFAPPSISSGVATYGPGTGSRYSWGGGFQLGLYYITDFNVRLGASYKSKQWFEPLHYNSNDALGNPVFSTLSLNLPAIVSVGAAYTGFERLLYAVDVRYFDYENALGFGGSGFRPDGAVIGLGWRSVVGVANGLQYSLTDRLNLRTGYTFIENPVPSAQEQFNVATALIMQHFYSVGASYQLRCNVLVNVAYTHGFSNSLTGPYVTPAGPLAGTSITSTTYADWITAGLTVLF